MVQRLKISISKTPQNRGVASCRNITIREKFMRFLFGSKQKMMVIIPGDYVKELAICEVEKGE